MRPRTRRLRADPDQTRQIRHQPATVHESAVARLVAAGMGNRQVASELFVIIKTVQSHLINIYAKLGLSSRYELAAQFREQYTTPRPMPSSKDATHYQEDSA